MPISIDLEAKNVDNYIFKEKKKKLRINTFSTGSEGVYRILQHGAFSSLSKRQVH